MHAVLYQSCGGMWACSLCQPWEKRLLVHEVWDSLIFVACMMPAHLSATGLHCTAGRIHEILGCSYHCNLQPTPNMSWGTSSACASYQSWTSKLKEGAGELTGVSESAIRILQRTCHKLEMLESMSRCNMLIAVRAWPWCNACPHVVASRCCKDDVTLYLG